MKKLLSRGWIIFFILLIVISGTGYYGYQRYQARKQAEREWTLKRIQETLITAEQNRQETLKKRAEEEKARQKRKADRTSVMDES